MNDSANEIMRRLKALQKSIIFWTKAAETENKEVLRLSETLALINQIARKSSLVDTERLQDIRSLLKRAGYE